MSINKLVIIMIAAGVAMASGCSQPAQLAASQPQVVQAPAATQPAHQGSSYLAANALAGQTNQAGDTPIESALNWANKYEQATQTILELQKASHAQKDKSAALELQTQKLQLDLQGAQRELKDANAMLLEMRQELAKWKADILGFRQEMRASDQAQIQALSRILKLLGAEPVTVPTSAPASKPAMEPASEKNQ